MKAPAEQVIALVQSGGTMRFHTHAGQLIKTQDVAQHSYGVFWFVYALTGGRASAALLVNAMAHDAGERWIGDVPAPTKRQIPGLGSELARMEAEALEKKTWFRAPELTEEEAAVLKLADCFDGAEFCARESRMGNPQARGMFANFIEYIDECFAKHSTALMKAGLLESTVYFDLMQTYRKMR